MDIETLKIIYARSADSWLNGITKESANIIRNKLGEIPAEFFEPRISIDSAGETKISLVEFSMQTAGMNSERRNWLMDKYHINPYDINKLQSIVDSIRVAKEYGEISERKEENTYNENGYGIRLSDEKSLDKAYPLWLAYIYADSKNPIEDIKFRLEQDGMTDKYKPEYVVSLMEHTDSLMPGKSVDEKREFYMQTINGILDGKEEKMRGNAGVEIEI